MAVLSGERLHENMERLLPGARTAALLWQGAALAGGVLLGAALTAAYAGVVARLDAAKTAKAD